MWGMAEAVWWGVVASASLFVGQALARPLNKSARVTGLIMGFGAGTLLSAISYELLPEENVKAGVKAAVWMLVGAGVYYVFDRLLDRIGGGGRHEIRTASANGSGAAMFVGAALDGIPEALILGIGLATGGAISVAFLIAVLLSNIPQGVAGTTGLKASGYSDLKITAMWAGLTVLSGAAAGLGYELGGGHDLPVRAFAAGGVLMMLADSMIPEAYQHGGRTTGLATVLGFLCAAGLSVAA
jgi:ZIP family zinc transporter